VSLAKTVNVPFALCDIAAEHGELDPDAGTNYVQSLGAEKRYHRDVYYVVLRLHTTVMSRKRRAPATETSSSHHSLKIARSRKDLRVARESDGAGREPANTVCPLKCRERRRGAGDNPADGGASPRELVDWAGLPANLDLAFSPQQRDRVYVQHLLRKRGAQLWRLLPDSEQLCVCAETAKNGQLDLDGAKEHV
jgi:hypothetical protein